MGDNGLKAYKDYINFLESRIIDNATFLDIHGMHASEREIERGKELRKAIADSPKPDWISVIEKLPSKTEQEEVVFYAKRFDWLTGMFTPVGFRGEKDNVFQMYNGVTDEYITIHGVTHYMILSILPEPPKTRSE